MTQFVARVDESLAREVDRLVEEGVVTSRSAAVRLGLEAGSQEELPESRAATFDNLQRIRRYFLTQRVGRLDEASAERSLRSRRLLRFSSS